MKNIFLFWLDQFGCEYGLDKYLSLVLIIQMKEMAILWVDLGIQLL